MKKRLLLIPFALFVVLSVGAVKSDFALVRDTEIMINMMRALNQNYVDSLSSGQLLKDATRGMAKSLDPYTTYMNEEDMADFEIMTTGKYGGIGAVIQQKGDYVVISQPYKNSPADKAGLMIGDKILEVGGESAKGWTTKQVSDKLKGLPSTNVKVKVLGVLDSAERRVTIKRERIQIPSIPYAAMLRGDIGYVSHTEFTDGCYEEMRTALINLQKEGMNKLILDYRSNGGGVMQEAIKVLSLFVPKGSVVLTVKGRADSTLYRTTRDPLFLDIPIVALVDGNSASAAEIVAGALQDMDRAVLLGERSFGKGLVQSTISVGFDSYLKLTTARYYIPSGRCIQEVDYTDHSSDRETRKMADSLRREFYTVGGRKVYDGGGITPDIVLDVEYTSRFAVTLYAKGFIEEWGERYFRRNHAKVIDVEEFELTDADFEEFRGVVAGRDVEYKSKSSIAIKSLEAAAKSDRNEELMAEIERLKESLKDDTESNLTRYKTEIMRYMKRDVLLRYAYSVGVLSNEIARDKWVARAEKLLNDEQKMEAILSGEVQCEGETQESDE